MKPSPNQTEFSSVEETAALWFARLRDGLPPVEEANFQKWLAADPRHAAAISELQAAWNAVSFPALTGRAAEAGRILDGWEETRRRLRLRLRYVYAATCLAAAAAVIFAFLPARIALPKTPAPETFAVRPNIQTLPDGSTAELNDGAEIAVEFTPAMRAVRLVHGEALFTVTKNASRPFVVSAGGVNVRAVGTAFSVRFDPQQVGVLVTEGRVAVERVASNDAPASTAVHEPVYLGVGDRIALAVAEPISVASAVKPLTPEQMSAALAWRGKRVEFSRMALSDAVELFNRQNQVHLTIVDEATRTLPISGIFWADDPEAFARLLESGMGVRVERSGSVISLSSR